MLRSWIHLLLRWLVSGLMKTLRWEVEGLDHLSLPHQQGMLLCGWHDELALSTYYLKIKDIKATMVVSQHQDGQIIADILTYWGFPLLRGSTQSKGALHVTKQMLKDLEKPGYIVALTSDGPRGPRHVMKSGALRIADQCGAKIQFIRAFPTRYWRLNSWDRFIIPKPFSKVIIIIDSGSIIKSNDGTIDIDAMTPIFI